MKKLSIGLIIGFLFLSCNIAFAQSGLYATGGAIITVQSGAGLYVNGPISLANTSTLNNAGTVTIARQGVDTADFNDQSVTPYAYGTGKFIFTGTGVQNVKGGTFNELELNNASGLKLLSNINIGNNLNIINGSVSILANTLTLNGSITGSGFIKGSPLSNLHITGVAGNMNFDQTDSLSRSLKDLVLNNGNATLANPLNVYNEILLTTSTLNLAGKHLTLKSTDANTARIGNLTGSTLSNASNVTMERFIKLRTPGTGYGTGNYGRAYRLVTPTVNTATSVRFNWMNNEMNNAIGVSINNAAPGYGIQITGAGGNANGFDVTQSNESSMYNASNAITPAYTAVSNTNGMLNALTGYFIYVRGDRSMSTTIPLSINMPTSSTTLRANGTIVQGPVSGFTNAYTGGGTLNLVTNPYPSPIDWQAVRAASSNITDYYTYWNPNVGTRGGFVTVSSAEIGPQRYIQSGQAFFVESNGIGVPVVNMQESHKASGNNNEVFLVPPPPNEAFSTLLYFKEPSNYRRLADEADAWYGSNFNAAVNEKDAKEINNWNENIAILRENKRLSVEQRPVIVSRDTIPLFMNNMKQRAYEFEFRPQAFTNTSLSAELIDNFLGSRTLLSVIDSTIVNFSVTADVASSATNRFMVVFGAIGPLPIDVITITAQTKNNGVEVKWISKTETDMDRYEVERSVDGTNFAKQNTTAAIGNSNSPVNYNWLDVAPVTGNNFYRIKAFDKTGLTKYSAVVKVTIQALPTSISIKPNPVTGSNIGLQLNNIDKGSYTLILYNNLGQQVYETQVNHTGGTAFKIIPLSKALANGNYRLLISGKNKEIFVTQIIKAD
jgi:hypothetical protein